MSRAADSGWWSSCFDVLVLMLDEALRIVGGGLARETVMASPARADETTRMWRKRMAEWPREYVPA